MRRDLWSSQSTKVAGDRFASSLADGVGGGPTGYTVEFTMLGHLPQYDLTSSFLTFFRSLFHNTRHPFTTNIFSDLSLPVVRRVVASDIKSSSLQLWRKYDEHFLVNKISVLLIKTSFYEYCFLIFLQRD